MVAATVAAEAAGPFWGGLIVSLPIAAGPAYVMLALQHDAGFIAASALGSFAVNAASFVFLAALALLAVRVRWGWALAGSLGAWAGAVLLIRQVAWDLVGASLLNLGVVLACLALTRSVGRETGAPGAAVRRRWFELPVRAAMVGLMVGGVVTGSRALGPALTGMAAVFPVAFTSFALLVLPRVGGDGGGGDHGERSAGDAGVCAGIADVASRGGAAGRGGGIGACGGAVAGMVGDADGGTRQAAAGGVRLVLSRSRSRRCDTGAWGLAAGSRDAAVAAGRVAGAWGSGSGMSDRVGDARRLAAFASAMARFHGAWASASACSAARSSARLRPGERYGGNRSDGMWPR